MAVYALLFLVSWWSIGRSSVDAFHEAPCRTERVLWTADRPLRIADFQGELGRRDHAAEANTGIATESRPGLNSATFVVEATSFFDPCKSWFRRTPTDSLTLAHEQLHFDITELFSRKLMRRYASEVHSHAAFARDHARIYNEVWDASRAMQDAYDQDVYADESRQAHWNARIAQALSAEAAYASKRIEIPMR